MTGFDAQKVHGTIPLPKSPRALLDGPSTPTAYPMKLGGLVVETQGTDFINCSIGTRSYLLQGVHAERGRKVRIVKHHR